MKALSLCLFMGILLILSCEAESQQEFTFTYNPPDGIVCIERGITKEIAELGSNPATFGLTIFPP